MSDPQSESTRMERRPDRAALVIAMALFLLAALIVWDMSRLGTVASYARIGPQSIPYVIAVCLAALGAWTAIAAFRGDFPERERIEAVPVLFIVAALAVQIALLNVAGFAIATGLMFAITARGLGRINFPLAVVTGIVLSALVWLLFSRVLSLTLPAGPLENLLVQGVDALLAPFKAARTGA